ncbi:MAG: hypothetical protein V2I43_01065 [Parvularcula sp.]|nr:hypothetical protein [Parvularcula sp.]
MRHLIVGLLGLLLVSCASLPSSTSQDTRPKFGYRCEATRSGAFGLVEVSIDMRDGQQPQGFVKWDAGDGTYQNPWITAVWYMGENQRFSLDNGYADVMWHISQIDRKGRDIDDALSLQFRASTNERSYGNARLSSPYQRYGGPFHISVDWPLLSSLAAGTDQLFLVAQDDERVERLRIAIDPEIFVRAEPHVIEVMREIEGKISNPASACKRHDFTEEDSIIVV